MKKSYFIKLLWPLFLVGSLWGSQGKLVNVVLSGPGKSGKTALFNRLKEEGFSTEYKASIGPYFAHKEFNTKDAIVLLQVWDTGGQEKYRNLSNCSYTGANGAVICYDITDSKSFEALDSFVERLIDYAYITSGNKINLVICGTKSDLKKNREVSEEEGKEYAGNVKTKKKSLFSSVTYIETSAKNNTNVEKLFKHIANNASGAFIESQLSRSESDSSKNKKVEKNAEDNSITNFFKDHWQKLWALVVLILTVIPFLSENASI